MKEVDGAWDGHDSDAGAMAPNRWKEMLSGPVGGFLSYGGIFAAVFVLITLLLWIIENYRK